MTLTKTILPESFYLKADVVTLSKAFLGKVLCTNIDGQYTAGIITETEAYVGAEDKASHAYGDRKTSRTSVMYEKGGIAYVYLCYGIHCLFNIVTQKEGVPHAILVRGIQPIEGIQTILKRRKKTQLDKKTAAGPGTLSQALGITLKQNGLSLQGNEIWIEDRGIKFDENDIQIGARIGVDYAGEDAKLPYRFLYTGIANKDFT